MNIMQLFEQARIATAEQRLKDTAEKPQSLRGGNAGVMSSSGDVAGSCLRTAHLRTLGIEEENRDPAKGLMFDLGFANEDVVVAKLQKSLPEGYSMLREEEIPVEWTTSTGMQVTGRPDIVILRDGKPELGLELKSVHSMWPYIDVFLSGKPKLSNVIQAAHYMWKLGNIPYKLIYTSYSSLGQGLADSGDSWILRKIPKPGQKGSEFVDYTYYEEVVGPRGGKKRNKVTHEQWLSLPYDKRSYGIKGLKQREIVYDIQFSAEGNVQYKLEQDSQWLDTVISRSGIERFYEAAARVGTTEEMPVRPKGIDLYGEKSYSPCDYCVFRSACDTEETNGYTKWVSKVVKLPGVSNPLKKFTE